jgi:hypothetical protein
MKKLVINFIVLEMVNFNMDKIIIYSYHLIFVSINANKLCRLWDLLKEQMIQDGRKNNRCVVVTLFMLMVCA